MLFQIQEIKKYFDNLRWKLTDCYSFIFNQIILKKKTLPLEKIKILYPKISMAGSDSILARKGNEIEEFLKWYTVAFVYLEEANGCRFSNGGGTGIFFKFHDRYFLLTAGHCLANREKRQLGFAIASGYKNSIFFTAPIVNENFINVWEPHKLFADYGYIEFAKIDAKKIEAEGNIFLGENTVFITNAKHLKHADDWMVLSGFPGVFRQRPGEPKVSIQQQHISCILSGTGRAPVSRWPKTKTGVIDLWVSDSGCVETIDGNFEEVIPPDFRGVSGGGCWKSNVRGNGTPWRVEDMKLVAIHNGTLECKINNERNRFCRSTLIGNHLKLLATDYPDLKKSILSKWPTLYEKH